MFYPSIGSIDIEIRDYLLSQLLNDLNNSGFIQHIKDYLNDSINQSLDLILESIETQNGKTKLCLVLIWIINFYQQRLPIIIMNDSIQDINQLINRVNQFNLHIKSLLDLKGYICTNLYLYFFQVVSVTPQQQIINELSTYKVPIITLNPSRYRRLSEIVDRIPHHRVTIIYDEADMSVGTITNDKVSLKKEKIWRQFNNQYGKDISYIYITATAFAIYNSPHRTCRNIRYLNIPNDLYCGYEYRGYLHPTNIIHTTQCIEVFKDNINNLSECPPKYFDKIISILTQIVSIPMTPNQPNIALINIFFRNNLKYLLCTFIKAYVKGSYIIAIYTGDKIDSLQGSVWNTYKICIEQYLTLLKNSHCNIPILIIATRKANRSQTFKSCDGLWKLTHMILSINPKTHMENLIQSIRGTGQFLKDAVGMHIYLSNKLHNLLKRCILNKMILSHHLTMKPSDIPYPIWLSRIQLVPIGIKMSRKDIDHTRFIGSPQCTPIIFEEMPPYPSILQIAPTFSQIKVTDLYHIPVKPFIDVFKSYPIDVEQYQNQHDNIQNWIIQWCQQHKWINPDQPITCQLCPDLDTYYKANTLRYLKENELDQYNGDIIGLHPNYPDPIPIVIYRPNIPADLSNIPPQSIIIWDCTNGRQRCYLHGFLDDVHTGSLYPNNIICDNKMIQT